MRTQRCTAAALALLALPSTLAAASLRGSSESLAIQARMARQHDYTYLRTSSQVKDFAGAGLLVELAGNRDYDLADVSFPYARPEVRTFVERLGRQYRAACGERLVVTSLTRPKSRQPHNASHLSVHPTGMAVDLRQSRRAACRAWLEKTLLTLERRDLLEATRERWPAHYHVALFPAPYRRYVAGLGGGGGDDDGTIKIAASRRHKVRRGDTLWSLARRYGTSVDGLRRANGMRSSQLKAGQVLTVPAR